MHNVHAILIYTANPEADVEDLQEQAMGAIEPYVDQAYDYCRPLAPHDVEPSDEMPGVVVRGTDARFASVLQRWANQPVIAAKRIVDRLTHGGLQPLTITPKLISRMWQEDPDAWWDLRRAIELVTGVYTFDSGFYSAPDGQPKLRAETRAALRDRPERFALVFLDLHI